MRSIENSAYVETSVVSPCTPGWWGARAQGNIFYPTGHFPASSYIDPEVPPVLISSCTGG